MRIEHMTLCVSKPTRHAAALIAAIAAGKEMQRRQERIERLLTETRPALRAAA